MLFTLFITAFIALTPFLIGSFGVLQNTINKKIAEVVGLPLALVVNNLVLLFCSLMLFALFKMIPESSLPDIFRQKQGLEAFNWKFLLPGLLGFFIIATAPWVIAKVGATKVFIGIIAAQVVISLLWDYLVEPIPMSPSRIVGAGLALAGAILAAR